MNQALPAGSTESTKAARHWSARLDLDFASARERTCLTRKEHHGPLRVQRLFHPDANGKAHCYLLHPPGGVVLGDELSINVCVRSGAALVTTPSAGRFYSVADFSEIQTQRVTLRATAGLLEWLPQETIVFNGANARLTTEVELEGNAQLAFWEVLVLGRPAAGEIFDRGACSQCLTLRRAGRPVLRERLQLQAGDRIMTSRLGLGRASTLGIALFTFVAGRALLEDWLETVNGPALSGPFSVTQRGSEVIARYVGEDAFACRAGFSVLWRRLTRARDGHSPSEPRIWHT
jgi:urease accessory protein